GGVVLLDEPAVLAGGVGLDDVEGEELEVGTVREDLCDGGLLEGCLASRSPKVWVPLELGLQHLPVGELLLPDDLPPDVAHDGGIAEGFEDLGEDVHLLELFLEEGGDGKFPML